MAKKMLDALGSALSSQDFGTAAGKSGSILNGLNLVHEFNKIDKRKDLDKTEKNITKWGKSLGAAGGIASGVLGGIITGAISSGIGSPPVGVSVGVTFGVITASKVSEVAGDAIANTAINIYRNYKNKQ